MVYIIAGGYSDIWVRRFCGYSVVVFCGGGGGGSSQNWTIFRSDFYAFYGLFFRSRMGDIFLGC